MISAPSTSRSVEKSGHLRLHATHEGRHLAYHSLFGNLAWLDDPLFEYLSRSTGTLRYEELESEVGADVASVLWNSYFIVTSADEERELISGWLAERAAKLETGYYLGGLQISSSNACNFACSYCFADAADRRSGVRQKAADASPNITLETAAKAIEQVRAVARSHGRSRIGVKFLGREPLINWKVMRRLMSAYPDGDVAWSVTTNGSLLGPDAARELHRHDVRVMISLDGPPSVNDRLRTLKVVDSGPTYALVEPALRNLAEVGHRFGVSTVISRATDFSVMPAFIDRLRGFGADEIELTLVMQTDPLRAQARYGEVERFAEQLIGLYQYASSQGLLVHGDWLDPFHRILSTHKFRDEGYVVRPLGAGCTATEHQISIEPTGDLFPCRAMSLHYGHVDEMEAALRGEGYRRVVMRTYYNVPYCRGCELEGHCQGTCLGSAEEASGDIYNPQEEYCTVYRQAARLLLRGMKPRLSRKEYAHAAAAPQ
jgi:uncharacterized protein